MRAAWGFHETRGLFWMSADPGHLPPVVVSPRNGERLFDPGRSASSVADRGRPCPRGGVAIPEAEGSHGMPAQTTNAGRPGWCRASSSARRRWPTVPPRRELHGPQAATMLSRSLVPPSATARTWSALVAGRSGTSDTAGRPRAGVYGSPGTPGRGTRRGPSRGHEVGTAPGHAHGHHDPGDQRLSSAVPLGELHLRRAGRYSSRWRPSSVVDGGRDRARLRLAACGAQLSLDEGAGVSAEVRPSAWSQQPSPLVA